MARSDAALPSSIAIPADAFRTISIACCGSRFSGSKAFIHSVNSAGLPARCPLSTSEPLTRSFRVRGLQPIFAAIAITAGQVDGGRASGRRCCRTARLRTEGEKVFVVLLMMPCPAHGSAPEKDPARFSAGSTEPRHRTAPAPPPDGLALDALGGVA